MTPDEDDVIIGGAFEWLLVPAPVPAVPAVRRRRGDRDDDGSSLACFLLFLPLMEENVVGSERRRGDLADVVAVAVLVVAAAGPRAG